MFRVRRVGGDTDSKASFGLWLWGRRPPGEEGSASMLGATGPDRWLSRCSPQVQRGNQAGCWPTSLRVATGAYRRIHPELLIHNGCTWPTDARPSLVAQPALQCSQTP